MRQPYLIVLSIILAFAGGLTSKGFAQQYQNYNHGYCPTCDSCPGGECGCAPCGCYVPATYPEGVPNPCDDCSTVCGTQCGISAIAIGLGIAAVIAAAALIVGSGNGSAKD